MQQHLEGECLVPRVTMSTSPPRPAPLQTCCPLGVIFSNIFQNCPQIVVVLLLLLFVVPFTAQLSIDSSLLRSNQHHHYHSHHNSQAQPNHSEWEVDDWWRQTIEEDARAAQLESQNDRLARLRSFDDEPMMVRMFEPRVNQATAHHQHRGGHPQLALAPDSMLTSPSTPIINFVQLTSAATADTEQQYDSEPSFPSKRWPTKVQFPSSSSSSSSFHSPRSSSNGDLDTAESVPFKSSTSGGKSLTRVSKNNNVLTKWKSSSSTNQTKSDRRKSTDSKSYIPKSSLSSIQTLFNEYFLTVRSGASKTDRKNFYQLKRQLRKKFLDLGLQTGIHEFNPEIQKRPDKGHNIIGIYPGVHRNKDTDSVLVIGAHYDTVPQSMGIEDNASGSVAVIEIARLLHTHKCKLNSTVMFVLFDMEEDGLYGSKHFVRDYLLPEEIEKKKLPVKGAIVIDMLLEYDTEPNSQITSDLGPLIPSWNEAVTRNNRRADFAAVWARRSSVDTALYKSLQRNWQDPSKYKLLLLDPPLPKQGRQLTVGLNSRKLTPYKTFLRSDHSSFWYPHSAKDLSIPAILLTDLGPWRRKVAHRYHTHADNDKLLTKNNLLFLKNSIDSILRTILDVGGGQCRRPPGLDNSVEAATAA